MAHCRGLVGVLLFAVFGVHREPFIGTWTSSYACSNTEEFVDGDIRPLEGINLTFKRNGEF